MLQSKTSNHDVKEKEKENSTKTELPVDEQIEILASVIIELLLNENISDNEEESHK
jgi:hypothetical protein